jgi:hypothetical protein
MPSSIDQKIRSRIEQFVTDLHALIREAAVASVADALADARSTSPAALARRPDAARMGRRVKGAKRDPQVLESLTDRLLGFIAKNAGQRIEQIAASLGTTTKELALPAKKLIGEKKVRTTGQKRATKYFAR